MLNQTKRSRLKFLTTRAKCSATFFLLFSTVTALAADQGSSLFSDVNRLLREEKTVNFSLRIDCQTSLTKDGAQQDCLKISGARLNVFSSQSERLYGVLQINPLGSPSRQFANYPLSGEQFPKLKDWGLRLVERYGVFWQAKPGLIISLEDYAGAAIIQNVSGLSSSAPLDDSGWDQTAITVGYLLGEDSTVGVKFALGNGEGENGENLDPQQYLAAQMRAGSLFGLSLYYGVSFDGNNFGSQATEYNFSSYDGCGVTLDSEADIKGFSAFRQAVGLIWQGENYLNGLAFAVGMQKSTFKDLDTTTTAFIPSSQILGCKRLTPEASFVEDETGELANRIESQVYGFNGAFRIMDRYILGFDLKTREIKSKVPLTAKCLAYTDGVCSTLGESKFNAEQVGWAAGISYKIEPELWLKLEWSGIEYASALSNYFYYGAKNEPQKNEEFVNLRLEYNWF